MTALGRIAQGMRTFASDVAQGFFEITHNGFALVGLTVVFAVVTLTARPDLRQAGEVKLMSWLQQRQIATLGMEVESDAVERATATNPKSLPKQQAAVAYWLSRKYRVAPEPLGALVAEAYEIGTRTKIDPTLILAVMAVESGFNPFAQSPVGAQGLMQVMTGVHSDKYASFGGKLAAFDPVTNLRVGVKVLQECIARAGSLEGGLKFYVGAANMEDDNGYAGKVLAEHQRRVQPFAWAALVSRDQRLRTATMYDRNILVEQTDPELWAAIQAENARQEHHIELIASENYASPAVMAAPGTQLTNKYAEGYPGKRYYGGCEHVDVAEQLAIDRVKQIFGADAANVQPHCGASANEAVFLAFLKPGDTIMGMSLAEGGHLTHGMALNMSGKWFNVVSYGLNDKEEIDYDAMERKAHETRPN
jgi:hypothetical protein